MSYSDEYRDGDYDRSERYDGRPRGWVTRCGGRPGCGADDCVSCYPSAQANADRDAAHAAGEECEGGGCEDCVDPAEWAHRNERDCGEPACAECALWRDEAAQ